MRKKLVALIPHIVHNRLVIFFYDILSLVSFIQHKEYTEHIQNNHNQISNHQTEIQNNHGYIEDQNTYSDLAYGTVNMKYAGCEIFACYNALQNLIGNVPHSLAEMISYFEQHGIALSGRFGTSPRALQHFMKSQGFQTRFSTNEKLFDSMGEENDCMILTLYNDKDDITRQVHTITLTKKEKQFYAHNVYCNGTVLGPYDSVSDTIQGIHNGKAKGICLIGIKKADNHL